MMLARPMRCRCWICWRMLPYFWGMILAPRTLLAGWEPRPSSLARMSRPVQQIISTLPRVGNPRGMMWNCYSPVLQLRRAKEFAGPVSLTAFCGFHQNVF